MSDKWIALSVSVALAACESTTPSVTDAGALAPFSFFVTTQRALVQSRQLSESQTPSASVPVQTLPPA